MLTAGRISSYSNPADDKSADSFTCPHEHTISGPDVDSHTGTHSKSDDFLLCHPRSYTNFGGVGNGYIHSNGRTDTYELPYAVSDTNQHPDSRTYGHTDRDKFSVADTSSNRHERPNGDIHTDDNRHTVTNACPHHHADSHKPAYINADTSTHSRPNQHTFTHTHSHRDAHTEFFRTR